MKSPILVVRKGVLNVNGKLFETPFTKFVYG